MRRFLPLMVLLAACEKPPLHQPRADSSAAAPRREIAASPAPDSVLPVTPRPGDNAKMDSVRLLLLMSTQNDLVPADTFESFNAGVQQIVVDVHFHHYGRGWTISSRARDGTELLPVQTAPIGPMADMQQRALLVHTVYGCTPVDVSVDLNRPDKTVAQRWTQRVRLACGE